MEHRVAHQSSVLPHPLLKDAGASRHSTAAISDPQVRVSWFPSRFLLKALVPVRLIGLSHLGPSETGGTVPVQRAPRGGVV